MDKPTGEIISFLREANRKDLGKCEVCGNEVSNPFVSETCNVYRRGDGVRYIGLTGSSLYGHKECLDDANGYHLKDNEYQREGNVYILV